MLLVIDPVHIEERQRQREISLRYVRFYSILLASASFLSFIIVLLLNSMNCQDLKALRSDQLEMFVICFRVI